MALQAVALGLFAALCFGFADFLGAKASKKFGGITTAFFINVIGNVLFAAVFFLFLRQHWQYDLTAIVRAAVGGAVFTLGTVAFFKGLEFGPVSLVSPLGSAYPLVVTAIFVLFGATVSAAQLAGIVLVVAGLVLAAGLLDTKLNIRRVGRGPALGLLAAILWGGGVGLYTQSIEIVGWQQTTLVQSAASTIVLLIAMLLIRHSKDETVFSGLRSKITSSVLLGAALLQLAGLLAVNGGIGVLADYAAAVVAVSATYPVLTVFLALRQFSENISRPAFVGALIAIAGVVVLSLG